MVPKACPLAPTTESYHVSDPYMASPCPYATDHITRLANSGPYVVSNNQTYYRNRVYLSLDEIHATNSCGQVGRHHKNALLTVESSSLFSVGGYHHAFM